MDDPHQVNAIVATAIRDFFKDHPERSIDVEDAKLLGKQIVAALNAAGLQVSPAAVPGDADERQQS